MKRKKKNGSRIVVDVDRARCAHLTDAELRAARHHVGVLPSHVDGPPLGAVIGEAPGPNATGFPLMPWPPTSTAARLITWGRITAGEYLGRLHRRNLFDRHSEEWSKPIARERALAVRAELAELGSLRILLLGRRVSDAFGLGAPWQRMEEIVPGPVVEGPWVTLEYIAIPHPSGLNLDYNEEHVRQGAGAALLWAAGFTP